jgi:DNA-binding response OmpR family regulator
MQLRYGLIAESDPIASRRYAAAIRDSGLGSMVVRDGMVALSTMLERGAPALFVLDLELPGVDGFEVLQGLRRTVPEGRTQVLVISADRALRDRAGDVRHRLGIGAILSRAATEESLRRVVRRLVGGDEGARPATVPPPARPMKS